MVVDIVGGPASVWIVTDESSPKTAERIGMQNNSPCLSKKLFLLLKAGRGELKHGKTARMQVRIVGTD